MLFAKKNRVAILMGKACEHRRSQSIHHRDKCMVLSSAG